MVCSLNLISCVSLCVCVCVRAVAIVAVAGGRKNGKVFPFCQNRGVEKPYWSRMYQQRARETSNKRKGTTKRGRRERRGMGEGDGRLFPIPHWMVGTLGIVPIRRWLMALRQKRNSSVELAVKPSHPLMTQTILPLSVVPSWRRNSASAVNLMLPYSRLASAGEGQCSLTRMALSVQMRRMGSRNRSVELIEQQRRRRQRNQSPYAVSSCAHSRSLLERQRQRQRQHHQDHQRRLRELGQLGAELDQIDKHSLVETIRDSHSH